MRQLTIGLIALGCVLMSSWGGMQVSALAQQPPAAAGGDKNGNERLITMDFQDVDISVLVKFISEITGKNFIIDEKVRGKITIISPSKISVDEAYLVFQSVLQVKGFTTVPAGAIIKIVATKEARSSTLETVLPNKIPSPSDEYITRLIPLKFVDANNMVAVLQANGLTRRATGGVRRNQYADFDRYGSADGPAVEDPGAARCRGF